MRKFRFVGDPSDMHWHINPEKGESYDILQLNSMRNGDLLEFWMIENDRSWQEVTEGKPHIIDTTKPLHKNTDLGYYAGLFASTLGVNSVIKDSESYIKGCVTLAKELIKQLNEETK